MFKTGCWELFCYENFFSDFPNEHSSTVVIIEFHTDCIRARSSIGLCGTKISPITMN